MGTLWRSQTMVKAQVFLPTESAYEVVSALGEQGLVQFKDLNAEVNAFQRKFVNEVRRCDEMLRALRYFQAEIEREKLHLEDADTELLQTAPDATEMHALEVEFERLEREIKEVRANAEALRKQELELKEMREILDKTGDFFNEAEQINALARGERVAADVSPLDFGPGTHNDDRGHLGFVAGVVLRSKVAVFERLLWRACRGNVYVRRVAIAEDLLDPATNLAVAKDVFIVFYQGAQLEQRVRKICEGFEARLYPCPDNLAERQEMRQEVTTRLADLQQILFRTGEHLRRSLAFVAGRHPAWLVKVTKMKAVYHTLNKCGVDAGNARSLLGECWLPQARLGDIREAVREGAERSGSGAVPVLNPLAHVRETPPTYNVTNKFTDAFQTIIDAYGVANYQEVNPTAFTIITFPFLFAVMFGDWGHGVIMTLIAGFLVAKEASLAKFKAGGEVWEMLYGGRYIVLLMGLFSIYTGFVYNDCFAKPLTFGSSGWTLGPTRPPGDEFELEPPFAHDGGNFSFAYPLGIDPIWNLAENKLTFSNSYKMKMSIIFGIVQMGLGVVLSFFNHRHFNRPLNIWCEFIPQVLFLSCIFVYLVIMIVYKWLTPLTSFPEMPNGGFTAPSLLLMLINMFLKFGSPPEVGEVLYGDRSGSTQQHFQMFLVVVAVLCVPWMLLVKPFYLRSEHNKRVAARAALHGGSDHSLNSEDGAAHHHEEHSGGDHGGHGEHGEEFEFGEVFVHQAIHTIEYCLGCISNTASYLRLWALSLAHSQLSEVLWSMMLHRGLSATGAVAPLALFVFFAAWAVGTFVVLLVMEGLSAFLHALRLHWVEFQSKFYGASGYKFLPFDLRLIVLGKYEEAQS